LHKQKWHEVIDTLDNNSIDILGGIEKTPEIDSISKKSCQTKPKEELVIDIETDGELVINPVGDINIVEKPIISIDSLNIPEIPVTDLTGIVSYEEEEEEIILGMIMVETAPEFHNTPKNLSKQDKKEYFSKRIADIVSENFNKSLYLNLKGRQRVNTQFKIDKDGKIIDIKARAPHKKMEEEAIRVIKLLPQFIPAKQRGKPIKVVYSLPIIFQAEE